MSRAVPKFTTAPGEKSRNYGKYAKIKPLKKSRNR